ncbi:GPW/gp25 family protein [Flavobacterium hauense]
MEDRLYLGTGWSFPPHFMNGSHKGAVLVSGEQDIRESLRILLSTLPGERIFRFDYGCDIRQWVFSKMNLSEKTLITDVIEQAILIGEPRVILESVDVHIKDANEGILEIQLYYIVKETNSRSNMVYPFYFKEGTDLHGIPDRT